MGWFKRFLCDEWKTHTESHTLHLMRDHRLKDLWNQLKTTEHFKHSWGRSFKGFKHGRHSAVVWAAICSSDTTSCVCFSTAVCCWVCNQFPLNWVFTPRDQKAVWLCFEFLISELILQNCFLRRARCTHLVLLCTHLCSRLHVYALIFWSVLLKMKLADLEQF